MVEQGILYRIGQKKRVVVPKHLIKTVLEYAHDSMGHQGREKTLAILSEKVFWCGVVNDTDRYIKRCERCIRAKPLRKHIAPLQPILSSEPLELVCTDFLKLESAKGGYCNILLMTDNFTKFAQAIATTNQSARTTAKHLQSEFIYKFGIPSRLLSDQGGSFEGKVVKELCSSHGIKKIRTSPYHPETDGASERMNRNLLNMLRTLENYQKPDWKQHLARLVHAYNTTVHASTGFSPYYLMFGRQPRLPIDAILPNKPEGNRTADEYADDMKKKLQEAYALAATNCDISKQKQKKYHDRKIYGCQLDVGDYVLVKKHKFDGTHKIADRWEESIYKVLDKPNPDLPVYKVAKEGDKGKMIHRNNLMPVTWSVSTSFKEDDVTRDNTGRKRIRKKDNAALDAEDSDCGDEMVIMVQTQEAPLFLNRCICLDEMSGVISFSKRGRM